MTDAEKKMNKYTRSIERKLNMPREVKVRVMNDFISSIAARQEAGQTEEEIYAELGDPAKVAAELNEQMKEYTYRKSPWRWACLAVAVISGIAMLFGGGMGFLTYLLNKQINSSVGIIGGADGPTTIFVTTSPDTEIYQLGFCLLLFVMGLVGFFALCRRTRK